MSCGSSTGGIPGSGLESVRPGAAVATAPTSASAAVSTRMRAIANHLSFSVPPLGRRHAPGASIWIRALLQMLPDGRGKVGGQARLGQVLVDARGQRLLARAVEGVAGQREHGNALGDPVRL